MIFSDYHFIFWFLPLTLLFYHAGLALQKPALAKLVLLGASLIFYGMWKIEFLPILLFSILFNYIIAQKFQVTPAAQRTSNDKLLMAIGMAGNLSLLFYFKYLTFFAIQANTIFDTNFTIEKIILPLGISFFTFMQISYLFESYQGRVTQRTSLLDYTQFITFFPHLIAGPIILYKELIPQFNDPARMRIIPENIAIGIFLFALGLFKKIVIADSLAENAALPFDQGSSDFVRSWLGALSFTLQLYFDFSGYMDMAMGIAKLMNYDLPINFNSPFRAKNISTFWRRWHITMTRFFMNYIFTPLAIRAARKHGEHPPSKERKFLEGIAIPIIITFLLAGIWHGAGWTFIMFGLWHGFGLVIHRMWQLTGLNVPHPISGILTFLFVVFGFVIFRSPDLAIAFRTTEGMLGLRGFGHKGELIQFIPIFIALALALFPKNSLHMVAQFRPSLRSYAFTMALIVASLSMINRQVEFLYWQF